MIEIEDSQSPSDAAAESARVFTTPRKVIQDKVFLVYPPGAESVSLYEADMRRLQREGFLNDTIIELYLRCDRFTAFWLAVYSNCDV